MAVFGLVAAFSKSKHFVVNPFEHNKLSKLKISAISPWFQLDLTPVSPCFEPLESIWSLGYSGTMEKTTIYNWAVYSHPFYSVFQFNMSLNIKSRYTSGKIFWSSSPWVIKMTHIRVRWTWTRSKWTPVSMFTLRSWPWIWTRTLGVDMDMVTVSNRCPPNSDLHFNLWYFAYLHIKVIGIKVSVKL